MLKSLFTKKFLNTEKSDRQILDKNWILNVAR